MSRIGFVMFRGNGRRLERENYYLIIQNANNEWNYFLLFLKKLFAIKPYAGWKFLPINIGI